MACYDQTRCQVDPITGALTITTKHGSCTIEPGSDVSFTETGVGYIITIDGTPHIIPKPDEDDYGDNVGFTETEDSYIITINNVPHVIPKNCLQLIDCNGDYIDPCVDRVATCDNLADAVEGLGPQTQVSNGTGSQQNQNTYNVDHKGTYPNETIRTPWLTRAGDIATVNVWNPIAGEWDSISVESAEDIVVLNNPVIYLRKDTGQANPPIVTQDDLTVANAFNSFAAIRSFLTRTLLVGNITIDARGDFASDPSASAMGSFTPSNMKSAGLVTIRGDANDPENLIIPWGGLAGTGRNSGMGFSGGQSVAIRDLTFMALDQTVSGSLDWVSAISGTSNGSLSIGTGVKFAGAYHNDNPERLTGSYFLRLQTGAFVTFGNANRVIWDMEDNSRITAGLFAGTQCTIEVGGNAEWQILNGVECSAGNFIDVQSQAFLRLTGSVNFPDPIAILGAARHTATYGIRMRPLSSMSTYTGYGNRTNVINTFDFGVRQSGGAHAPVNVDNIAVIDGVAGP